MGKNDLNQNLKSKIKSQIIKSNLNHIRSKANQFTNQFHHSVNFFLFHNIKNSQRYKTINKHAIVPVSDGQNQSTVSEGQWSQYKAMKKAWST